MTEKISSIIDLFDRFETEQDCIRSIHEQRTEPGWTCPRCDAPTPSLPLVHHVISNFKSHIRRTYRGVTRDRLRSCADEFCWRYNHRGMKGKFEVLLADLCRRAKRERRQIPLLFMPQVVPLNKAA